MTNILTLIYFKLAELISTVVPSVDGMLNQFSMQVLNISNTSDPWFLINFIFETLLNLLAILIIVPLSFAYRLFMGLIGQPVPVPWF